MNQWVDWIQMVVSYNEFKYIQKKNYPFIQNKYVCIGLAYFIKPKILYVWYYSNNNQ